MTTTSELRAQLENQSEEISRLAHKIERRLGEATNWRIMVQERPLMTVAMAIGAGLFLSGAARPIIQNSGRQAATLAKGGLMTILGTVIQKKARAFASQL